jgi:hypothetical protein
MNAEANVFAALGGPIAAVRADRDVVAVASYLPRGSLAHIRPHHHV